MISQIFRLFFASMRLAATLDRGRLATDRDYPQTLINELCGDQVAGQNVPSDSRVEADDPVRRAA